MQPEALPEPAQAWLHDFRATVAVPFLDRLPAEHRSYVEGVFDEFVSKELRHRLGPRLGTPVQRESAALALLRLAVQREAVVTVTYRPGRAPKWLDKDLVRRVLVRIWDDEIVHEAYLVAVVDDARRLALERRMGHIGGDTAAVAAGAPAGAIRVARSRAVRIGGRAIGLITPKVARGLRRDRRTLGPWSATQAALELTAAVSYSVCAQLLFTLTEAWDKLRPGADRLASKLLEIGSEETWHATCFAAVCRAAAGIADAEDNCLLEDAARLVRTSGAWPQPPRLGRVEPRSSLRGDRSGLSAALQQVLPSVNWSTSHGLPVVALVCDQPLRHVRAHDDRTIIGCLVSTLAAWCRNQGHDAQLWLVGPSMAPDHAMPVAYAATAMQCLYVENVAGIDDPTRPLAAAQEVTTGDLMLLASYGTFATSNPDVLHQVWDLWALARLRLCVSRAPTVFDTLGQVVHSQLDYLAGPDFDGPKIIVDTPRLHELAALRMLGTYPPDLWLLTYHGQQAAVGTDLAALGSIVREASGEPLADDAWCVARLASSPSRRPSR